MTQILKPGAGVIFMKVGTHAQESLDDIIERKRKEIADAGYALWGYGGGTCHPQTMVQPFAKTFEKKGKAIYLCMEEMESRHFATPVRAEQSSPDGFAWTDIPPAINVLGSRYALVINDLHREEIEIPLSRTRVAVGPTLGRPGHLYVTGRVDKACLEVLEDDEAANGEQKVTAINLIAKIQPPYAVFLRNRS